MRIVQLRPRLLLLLVGSFVATSCVTKGTHETALSQLALTEARVDTLQAEMQREEARRDSVEVVLRGRIATLEAELAELEERRAQAEGRFQEAREEVYRLETLLRERGAEYQVLQRRLEALRAMEQEVRERNAIYEEVIAGFRSLVDAGQLSVSIQRGRLVINLPQDILFASGSATLGREGQDVITQVGEVLAEFPDRRFQVEGHTDDVPIATERFPSNWELSSARALAVVKLLSREGVSPENLSGAGFGEYQPVASNDDAEGRRRNRRIEIVMLPNLDVIAGESLQGAQER